MYMQIEQNISNETNTMKIHNELKEITKLSLKIILALSPLFTSTPLGISNIVIHKRRNFY